MGSTVDTFFGLMKSKYEDIDVREQLIYPANPLLQELQDVGTEGMVGDQIYVPIIYANPQGWSGGFTTAQTNASNVKTSRWTIECGNYYGVVDIGDKVMSASRNNGGAYLDNKETEIDGLWEQGGADLEAYCWGNGGNSIGRIGALDGNVVTLSEPSQIINFFVGQELVCSGDGDGSLGTETKRTGSSTVDAVDYAEGKFTWTASDISGEAVGDYLFREGDFFGADGTVIVKGVQCFVTDSATPPALWGVTAAVRAVDPIRFGGCRLSANDLKDLDIEERIKTLITRMVSRYGAKMPDRGWLNPEDWQTLELVLSNRGQRSLTESGTKFGYSYLEVSTPDGTLRLRGARGCPKGNFFAMRKKDWKLHSMEGLFHPQNKDGQVILRKSDSTDYQYRLICYPAVSCANPRNQGRCPLY